MPRHWLLFLLLSLAQTMFAQTFFATPGPLLEQEIAPEQANECYIFFENPGGDTLQLRWKKIEASIPAGWAADLCDLGACYVGIPASGIMNPAADSVQPYLKLIVQPGSIPGDAWIWFRVSELGNPDNYADVYFSLYTPGVTGSPEIQAQATRLFPNPSPGPVTIENLSAKNLWLRVTDSAGRLIHAGKLASEGQQMLDLSYCSPGLYFVQINEKTYPLLRQN